MILPIIAYGDPILKQEADEIEADYPNLNALIDNMFETMYDSEGVGLAAPQVGHSIRLFIIDASKMDESLQGLKRVFINPEVVELKGEEWEHEEGCLSIPHVREKVKRPDEILINYLDQNFKEQEERFTNLAGRVVQHEYDHIEGVLFTDRISALKRRMNKKKLDSISKGEVNVDYRMKFPTKKKTAL